MDDFVALLGNAAAVPVIIAITQLLKKNFATQFKRRADVISLLVSLGVCTGWWFYNTPEVEIVIRLGGGAISIIKATIDMVIISFATWLSASKSYDLFFGEKKRAKELDVHLVEKEKLRVELEAVRNGHEPTENEPIEEPVDLTKKLHAILEGRD